MANIQENQFDMSVIVTVFNIEKYIGACIESVLEEKTLNIEMILVDDSSTDRSLQICREYADRDCRVRIIHNESNLGITSSRNAGLKTARGEFLYIMDGDDLLKKGALQRMYQLCKSYDLDMLEFSADVFYESEDIRQYAKSDEYVRKTLLNVVADGPTLFADLQYQGESRWGSAYLHCYKGELMRKHKLWYVDGLRYADGSVFHLYLEARRVMCVKDVLYSRRVRRDSQITSSPKFYYLESLIILFIEELKRWDRCEFSEYINRGIEIYFRKTNRQIMDLYQQFKKERSHTYMLFDQHVSARYYFEHVVKRVPLCIDVFTEDHLAVIEKADRVFIYGAGFYGKQAAAVLDYRFVCYQFIVTDTKDNPKEINGKQVCGISDMHFSKQDIVIIAAAEKYQTEIAGLIEQRGCEKWIPFIV